MIAELKRYAVLDAAGKELGSVNGISAVDAMQRFQCFTPDPKARTAILAELSDWRPSENKSRKSLKTPCTP